MKQTFFLAVLYFVSPDHRPATQAPGFETNFYSLKINLLNLSLKHADRIHAQTLARLARPLRFQENDLAAWWRS
jgi:hypothetical protein